MSTIAFQDSFSQKGLAGEPISDCVVIDAHTHLGPNYDFPYVDGSVDAMVRGMDHMGIDRAYVSAIPAIFGQAQYGNDIIIAAMRKFPNRIRGYMVTDVGYAEMITPELERCYAAGMRGVKILSYGSRPGLDYDHPNYERVYAFANERGLPLLAHCWGHELEQLEPLYEKYPRINWIMAHTGSAMFDRYMHVANTYPNVYLETCFSACSRGLIEHIVAEAPLHKILWGTDQVFMSATHQLGRVLFAKISPAAKCAILGANAAHVLEGEAS